MITERLRFGLEKLRVYSNSDQANFLKLKTCMMIKPKLRLRNVFLNWNLQQMKKSVVEENENGCGPINIEAWNLKQYCNALKSIMRDDGQSAEFVDNFEQTEAIKSKQLIEKSITRMLIN